MKEKLYTLVFTDAELDVIYDALEELKLSYDDEYIGVSIGSIQNKVFESCKE